MGGCQSLYYEDEDEQIKKQRQRQQAREFKEFAKQLRQQRYYSELDLLGKGTSRQRKDQRKKEQNIKQKHKQREETNKKQATAEEIRFATDILYDA